MNLRNKYMQEALHNLKQRKQDNLALQQQRLENIHQNLPEIWALRQELAEFTQKLYLQLIEKPDSQARLIASLREKQMENDQKIQLLFKQNGYPADYLEPIYNCPDCKDSGFLANNQICTCLNREFIQRAYQQSNLFHLLEHENFENFRLDFYPEKVDAKYHISPRANMKDVFSKCQNFAETFGGKPQNLLLYGASGLGKTFLCSSIAKVVLDAGFSVIYLSAPEFFGIFEKYHFHHQEQVDADFIESLFACDLLILDDLGTEVVSVVTQQDLFQTINRRINEKKSTVISTNFSLNQISKIYSERIASRILGEYSPLLFFGQDIRKKNYFL